MRYQSQDTQYRTAATGGAANTKGAYVAVFAATGFDTDELYVLNQATSQRHSLYDLAIGAAGAEQILLPNVACCGGVAGSSNFAMGHQFTLGLPISANTRVALRCQDSTGGGFVQLHVAIGATNRPASRVVRRAETVGVSTTTSQPTTVDPGGTANAKGAYVQLTAAASFTYTEGLVLVTSLANTAPLTANFAWDLAIGAAGSEQIVVPDRTMVSEVTADNFTPGVTHLPSLAIPTGVRVSARAASSTNDATDRLFGLALVGLAA